MGLASEEEMQALIRMIRGEDRTSRACFVCRYWREMRDDGRTPRWGTCVRMSVQPFPGMMPMSEDPEMGAMLTTHPQFYCSEYEA